MRSCRPPGGVFRAKEDEWLSQAAAFPARPSNLQQAALAAADILLKFFQGAGYGLPQVEPILMFTDHRAHVDTVHPQTRIVLADAIEHFAAHMREQPPIMDREDGQLLIDALLHPPEAAVEEVRTRAPVQLPPSAVSPGADAGPFQLDERGPSGAQKPRPRAARGGGLREILLFRRMLSSSLDSAAFAAIVLYPDLL
jgi:hypothetical protein